jgi:hypothetical protein
MMDMNSPDFIYMSIAFRMFVGSNLFSSGVFYIPNNGSTCDGFGYD